MVRIYRVMAGATSPFGSEVDLEIAKRGREILGVTCGEALCRPLKKVVRGWPDRSQKGAGTGVNWPIPLSSLSMKEAAHCVNIKSADDDRSRLRVWETYVSRLDICSVVGVKDRKRHFYALRT